MANTVRIIPNSGSIAFASNVTNPSASLSSTSIVTKMDSATGVFAIASGSQNILTIDVVNKKVAVDNAIDFKIPVKDGNTYTALAGEIFVDQNAGEILWAGSGSSKGFKGNTGASGGQGPTTNGDPGAQGAQGPQNAPGIVGDKGQKGITGTKGNKGVQGPQGAIGPQGIQGPSPIGDGGDTGAGGDAGATGAPGSQGP